MEACNARIKKNYVDGDDNIGSGGVETRFVHVVAFLVFVGIAIVVVVVRHHRYFTLEKFN